MDKEDHKYTYCCRKFESDDDASNRMWKYRRKESWKSVGNNRGENVHQAKLTEDDVRAIRRLASEGATTIELVAMFPVSHSTIRSVIKRQSWKHVE